jgi:hypothetical protein
LIFTYNAQRTTDNGFYRCATVRNNYEAVRVNSKGVRITGEAGRINPEGIRIRRAAAISVLGFLSASASPNLVSVNVVSLLSAAQHFTA